MSSAVSSKQVIALAAALSVSAFAGFVGGVFYTDKIKTPIKEHHITERHFEVVKPVLASESDMAKIDALLIKCKEMSIQQQCSEDAIEFLESKSVTEARAQKIISSLQYQMLFKAAQDNHNDSKHIDVNVDVTPLKQKKVR